MPCRRSRAWGGQVGGLIIRWLLLRRLRRTIGDGCLVPVRGVLPACMSTTMRNSFVSGLARGWSMTVAMTMWRARYCFCFWPLFSASVSNIWLKLMWASAPLPCCASYPRAGGSRRDRGHISSDWKAKSRTRCFPPSKEIRWCCRCQSVIQRYSAPMAMPVGTMSASISLTNSRAGTVATIGSSLGCKAVDLHRHADECEVHAAFDVDRNGAHLDVEHGVGAAGPRFIAQPLQRGCASPARGHSSRRIRSEASTLPRRRRWGGCHACATMFNSAGVSVASHGAAAARGLFSMSFLARKLWDAYAFSGPERAQYFRLPGLGSGEAGLCLGVGSL